MENYLRRFRLYGEKEQPELVYDAISKAVPFQGTNLWILIFAIIIASLGLNVNSTAVVIGAMLISPLMGPIMGIGYSLSINDLPLLKKSLTNYSFAGLVGLAASTVYFLLTPIHEAHSELLSRTQPNLYDVLIAFFGGLAGILAACSKQKGNVIPGVAIATALMPPLCTAGYGLSVGNLTYFLGALYLYLINSVFISVATYLTVRYLNLPYRQFPDEAARSRSKRIITIITIVTLLPSVYFAYIIVQQNRFANNAKRFIEAESQLKDNVILEHKINRADRIITISYIGKNISDSTIEVMKGKLKNYDIGACELKINQGLSYLNEKKVKVDNNLVEVDKSLLQSMQLRIDSFDRQQEQAGGLYKEIKALYPSLQSAYIQPANLYTDSTSQTDQYLVYLKVSERFSNDKRERLTRFLETRLESKDVSLIIER